MIWLPEFVRVEESVAGSRELVRDIIRFAENEPLYFRSFYSENRGNTLMIRVPRFEGFEGFDLTGVLRHFIEVASFNYLFTIRNGSYSSILSEYLDLPMTQYVLDQVDARIHHLMKESEAHGEPTLRHFLEHYLGYYNHYSLLRQFSENSKRKHAA